MLNLMNIMCGTSERVKVFNIILIYWLISISMIFTNKHILTKQNGNIDVTIFIGLFQNLTSVFLYISIKLLAPSGWSIVMPRVDMKLFHSDVLKISFGIVASIIFNNLMLKNINISFYQMARSFTLVFTIMLSSSILKKSFGYPVIFSVVFIIIGYLLSVTEEESAGMVSVFGLLYGICASFTAALCGIYIKKAEEILEKNVLKTALYSSMNGVIILIPLAYSSGQLQAVFHSELMTNYMFWASLCVSGVFSFLLGLVSVIQIKYTSPVTHHISINAKSVVLTITAIMYYNESRTFLWWCGNILVIIGIALYTWNQLDEGSEENRTKKNKTQSM